MTEETWDQTSDADQPKHDSAGTSGKAGSGRVGTILLSSLAVLLLVATVGAGLYTYRLAQLRSVPQTLTDVSIRAQKDALKKDPENVALYLGLADLYYSAKSYDKALDALETLEKSNPAPAPELLALSAYGRGKIAYATGDKDLALEQYLRSLEITPTPDAQRDVGTLYLEREEYDSAIQNLVKYVELVPTDGAALVQLAKAYEGAGKTVEALQTYEQAATYLKDDPEITNAIARLKGQQ